MAPTCLRQERTIHHFPAPCLQSLTVHAERPRTWWNQQFHILKESVKYYPKIFNQFFLFGCNFCQRKTTAMFLPLKLISCILTDTRSCIQNLCVNNWTLCRPVTKTSEGILSYDLQEIKKKETRRGEERGGEGRFEEREQEVSTITYSSEAFVISW